VCASDLIVHTSIFDLPRSAAPRPSRLGRARPLAKMNWPPWYKWIVFPGGGGWGGGGGGGVGWGGGGGGGGGAGGGGGGGGGVCVGGGGGGWGGGAGARPRPNFVKFSLQRPRIFCQRVAIDGQRSRSAVSSPRACPSEIAGPFNIKAGSARSSSKASTEATASRPHRNAILVRGGPDSSQG